MASAATFSPVACWQDIFVDADNSEIFESELVRSPHVPHVARIPRHASWCAIGCAQPKKRARASVWRIVTRQAKSLCEFGAMFDDCDNEDEDDWGSTDFVHTLNNGARITVAEVCTQETGGQVGLWQHADGLDC